MLLRCDDCRFALSFKCFLNCLPFALEFIKNNFQVDDGAIRDILPLSLF